MAPGPGQAAGPPLPNDSSKENVCMQRLDSPGKEPSKPSENRDHSPDSEQGDMGPGDWAACHVGPGSTAGLIFQKQPLQAPRREPRSRAGCCLSSRLG